MSNNNLHKAKKEKNDEFYTQYEDIHNELQHYTEHFKNKIVYCNCDDPEWSNFWKYFYDNFAVLGLKGLISTHYEQGKQSYKLEYDGIETVKTSLTGDGDFRSEECVELLKQADVVCTNPPFSLFRELINLLVDFNKDFLLIGNKNAITYKEVFPKIQNNCIFLGYTSPNTFITSSGKVTSKLKGLTRWFTTLSIYEKKFLDNGNVTVNYPKYDNYNAVEVSKTKWISTNYKNIMGVPISFLDHYTPEQFEIIGATESEGTGFSDGLWDETSRDKHALINGKKVYKRIFIKVKNKGFPYVSL